MECECGAKVKRSWNWCPECRRLLALEIDSESVRLLFCSKCGRGMKADHKYCTFCGQPNIFIIANIIYSIAELQLIAELVVKE